MKGGTEGERVSVGAGGCRENTPRHTHTMETRVAFIALAQGLKGWMPLSRGFRHNTERYLTLSSGLRHGTERNLPLRGGFRHRTERNLPVRGGFRHGTERNLPLRGGFRHRTKAVLPPAVDQPGQLVRRPGRLFEDDKALKNHLHHM